MVGHAVCTGLEAVFFGVWIGIGVVDPRPGFVAESAAGAVRGVIGWWWAEGRSSVVPLCLTAARS